MQPSVAQKIERNGDRVNVLREYLFHVNVAVFGAALFYSAKPLARALNGWSVKCNQGFPILQSLAGL